MEVVEGAVEICDMQTEYLAQRLPGCRMHDCDLAVGTAHHGQSAVQCPVSSVHCPPGPRARSDGHVVATTIVWWEPVREPAGRLEWTPRNRDQGNKAMQLVGRLWNLTNNSRQRLHGS